MDRIISYKEFLNESKSALVNEANQEEQVKKEVISKLSDFFGCAPGNLSKFNFDGKDNIKELTKALRSTSDAGTEQYYRIAIIMAKRDLGINESEELNESALEIAGGIVLGLVGLKAIGFLAKGIFGTMKLKLMKDPLKLKDLAEKIYSQAITKDNKNVLQAALWYGAVKDKIDKGEIKNGLDIFKASMKMDKIDINKVFEDEGFDLTEDINEGKKEDLSVQLEAIFAQIKGMNLDKTAELAFTKAGIAFGFLDMLSKPGAIKNLQTKTPEAKKRMSDAREALNGANSSDEIKSILIGLIDTVSESVVNEAGDLAYWKQYETDNSPQAEGWESDQVRSDSGVKPLIDKCIKLWNKESESGAIDKKSEKEIHDLAMDFYKKFHYVTGSIVQAMIMQESY